MENFERGNRKSFKGGYKGRKEGFNGGDNRGPVTMHSAICSTCKKSCEVPFRPTGDKPVYCRDCFAGRAGMGGDRSNRRDFRKESRDFIDTSLKSNFKNDNGNNEIKKQLDSINIKLERLITVVQSINKIPESIKPEKEKIEPSIIKVKKVSKKK